MYLIVGLGNPEPEYSKTRHNMGFDVINKLSEKYNIDVKKEKFDGIYGSGTIENEKVILLKPQTYMNLSGKSIIQYANFYKIDSKNILVIYDDIDLPLSKLRVRKSGSAGTHNGMRSIVANVPGQNFPRIRVGVGAKPEGWDLADWVLSRYATREEQDAMHEAFEAAADCVETWLRKGIDEAMQQYNHK